MIRYDDRKLKNSKTSDHESHYNVVFHTTTNLKMTLGYSRCKDSDVRNMAHGWIRVETFRATEKEIEMAADLMLNVMQHKCLFEAHKSQRWVPKPTRHPPEGNATDASPRRPDHASSSSGIWGACAAAEAGVDEAVPTPLMPALSGQIGASSSSGEVGVDEAAPTPVMPAIGGEIAADCFSGAVGVGAFKEPWCTQTPESTPRCLSPAGSFADRPEGIAYFPGEGMHQLFDGPHSLNAKGYFVESWVV
jgi:hypothetical protein